MGKYRHALDTLDPTGIAARQRRDLERQVREQAAAKRTRFADIGDDYTMTPEGPRPVAPMPLPDGISITAGTEEIAFVWSGSASSQIPTDFGRLAIHASKFPGYTPTQGTEVATISSPYGGTTNYSADGGDTYYIRCAIASLRGDYGPFTDEVPITPRIGADGETFRGDVVGKSIAIATVPAGGDVDETFSGTTYPTGWTHTRTSSTLAGVSDPAVVSSGVPTGSDNGSALLFDFGAAGVPSGTLDSAAGRVDVSMAATVDSDTVVRFRHSTTPEDVAAERLELVARAQVSPTFSKGITLDIGRAEPRVHEYTNGVQALLGPAAFPQGGLVGGQWYQARLRVVGGRIEATVWEDGTSEPDPAILRTENVLDSGSAALRWAVAPFSAAATVGLDTYVDTVTIERLATGFTVNPDGTARMSAAEIGVLTITGGDTWHTVGDPGEPAYKNGWAASTNPVQLTKDAANNVHLRGTANVGTSGTVAFTLPAAYRPSAAVTIPASDNAGAFGRLIVRTNGDVEGYYSGAPARLNFNAVYLVRA